MFRFLTPISRIMDGRTTPVGWAACSPPLPALAVVVGCKQPTLRWLMFAAVLFAPHWAQAHAHLTGASPAVDSTVPTAPHEVTITYTEGVEPKFSTIEVLNAAGARVDTADVHTAPDDNKRLSVSVKPLTPGVYQVMWHATAVDTHKTEGHFSFTVAH